MASHLDPALVTAVAAALEGAINRALQLSPGTRRRLKSLEDEVFALHCTEPALDVYLQPNSAGLRLMGVWEGPVTTSVKGTASDFAELATSKDPAATLINGQLELKGDSAPLLEMRNILAGLDMDWEAPLTGALGDVAGHQLAQGVRTAVSLGKQATLSLGRQLEEFIHEEARLSPPRLEVEDFFRDIQALGLQVERLQSRADRLRRRLKKLVP